MHVSESPPLGGVRREGSSLKRALFLSSVMLAQEGRLSVLRDRCHTWWDSGLDHDSQIQLYYMAVICLCPLFKYPRARKQVMG